MPDGGIHLVVDLGDYIYSCFETKFNYENILLIVPHMRSDVQILHDEVLCFGVRFRPGAFSHFYNYDSIDHVANDFPRKNFPDLKQILTDFSNGLDQFFIRRFTPPKLSILECLSDIYTNNGLISVDNLAKKHLTSERQLERLFKQHLGLSPKKFANLERFPHLWRKH